MKLNKKGIGIGIGLVCVIILILLLLTRCGGSGGEAPTEPVQATVETTESVPETTAETAVETTEATEETEETTEATEETTEPTEESTEPTTGGNTNPGGTGGFEGGNVTNPDNDDDDDSTGVTEPVIAEPGTKENAYTEVLSQLPDSVSTVKISMDQTTYYNVYNAGGSVLTIEDENAYVIYGGKTYEPSEGVVTVALAEGEEGSPVSLELGTKAAEAAVLTLNYTLPLGSQANPVVLEDVTEFTASIEADDADGIYYSYTAMQAGKLELTLGAVDPAEAVTDIILTKGETTVKLSESTDGMVSMDMEMDETVIIQVLVTPEGAAADVTVNGLFTPIFGTQENPIQLMVPEDTMTVPAGQTLYYTGRVSGMVMTVTGENVTLQHNGTDYVSTSGVITLIPQGMSMWEPPMFAVTNTGDADAVYPVTFAYPVGHQENPDTLVIGENKAQIAAGSFGYFYTWTPMFDGILTITMDGANTSGWTYCINNDTAMIYGDTHFSDDDPLVISERVSVKADDLITVVVNTYDPTGFEAPEGTVSFAASFMSGSGTEADPYQLAAGLENELTVGPGETIYYQGRFTGMIMTVTGENVTVANNGETYTDENGKVELIVTGGNMFNPPVVAITNHSDTEKTYPVVFSYPLGTSENPEELSLGEASANIKSGDEDGYFYTWTADQDGILTLSIDPDNATGWVYRVNNLTSGRYGMIHKSDDEPAVWSDKYQVTAGDVLDINVSTYDPTTGGTPTGEVAFVLSFVEGYGTAEVPHPWYGATSYNITVGAGETVYYRGRYLGMILELTGENVSVEHAGTTHTAVNGTINLPVTEGDNYNPPLFAVTNHSDADASYTVTFTYPLGSGQNPQQITMGENSVTLAARDEDGYTFAWTAEADGELTITMSDANTTGWYYCINNLSAYRYGDQHSSADEQPVPGETIQVSNGDEITVSINTCGQDAWDTPAGTVTFTAEFMPAAAVLSLVDEEKEGTRENPDRIYDLLLNTSETEELVEIQVSVEADSEGFFYKWRVKEDGVLTFNVQEHPQLEDVVTDIVLWHSEDETGTKIEEVEDFFSLQPVDGEEATVSIPVKAGQEVMVQVIVRTADSDVCVDAELTIFGLFQTEEEWNETQTAALLPEEVELPEADNEA